MIKEKEERPMIASQTDAQLTEFIAKHLFERRAFYERADHTIVIDNRSPQEIAHEIDEILVY